MRRAYRSIRDMVRLDREAANLREANADKLDMTKSVLYSRRGERVRMPAPVAPSLAGKWVREAREYYAGSMWIDGDPKWNNRIRV